MSRNSNQVIFLILLYFISAENQVLQVIGKIPKRLPGEYSEDESNVSQDKGGSDSDSCSLNNDSIFYPDHNSYTPTVDKSQRWRFRIGINLFNRYETKICFCLFLQSWLCS